MSQILNYDNQDIDLNSLFNFGFEPLKNLIATIAKSQKDSLKRIENIENKVSLREKKIDELDKQLKKQENFMAMKFKTLSNSMVGIPRGDGASSNNDIEENVNQLNINQISNQNLPKINDQVSVNDNNSNIDVNLNKIKIGSEDGNRKLLVNLRLFKIIFCKFIS